MNAWTTLGFAIVALLARMAAGTTIHDDILAKCPARTDPCMNAINLAQCKSVERRLGCKILASTSCPKRFSCFIQAAPTPRAPKSTPTKSAPPPTPTKPPKNVSPPKPQPCPDRSVYKQTKFCPGLIQYDAKVFAQCLEWIQRGCTNLSYSTEPGRVYSCDHALPATPPKCPKVTAPAMNPTNRAQCLALVQSGCRTVQLRDAYPLVEFDCADK